MSRNIPNLIPAPGHGRITLRFGYGPLKTEVVVHGGPFVDAPNGHMHTVNLREEATHLPADQYFPIKDFSVPNVFLTEEQLQKMLEKLLEDGQIYAGCAGGIGRTGLVLALLASVSGVEDPVLFVRENFHPHAVETSEQKHFVDTFPAEDVQRLRQQANREGVKQAILRPFRSLFR